MSRTLWVTTLAFTLAFCGCDDGEPGTDAATGSDGGARDAGGSSPDAGSPPDGGARDGGARDAGAPPAPGELPYGDMGIAARYPGDVGVAGDDAVVFHDDFEGYASASELTRNWNGGAYHHLRIATEPANVHAGARALEMRSPRQSEELSNAVARMLGERLDVLFLRFHSRFDGSFDAVGSSHNGGGISGGYYVDGRATPGVPANGTNKFLIEYECWRGEASDASPGLLNVYIYHPEQRSMWGDHFFPDGTVLPNSSVRGDFGPDFVARANRTPELGRWYAYEVMLRANTPGMRDGRVALWLDGELIADFRNLRLRDVETLRIDRFNLSLHIGSNTRSETFKWYDDVVAATEYIGPLYTP
ncbi:MAG: hypothetical protein KF729_20645 [Sandaracinaceae bacterium]|nr:hypothetical protein [Sandaracinaceae bacterium]